MHVNHDSPPFVRCKGSGLDMRINQSPLAGPVVADPTMTVHAPTFHSVRPIHIRMHSRERRVEVASIKSAVYVYEKSFL